MLTNEENTTATKEGSGYCFVRHPDAGGQCWEPEVVEVHGLCFCKAHGEEARIGAALEAYDDANWFLERLRNPHVPKQSDGIERALELAQERLRGEVPPEPEYERALEAAYPEIPEDTRRRVVNWQLDEVPGELGVYDILRMNLHTLHKLLRIAHAEGMTWLVEVLEEERHALAAQAAYALRNPDPPEPDEE